MKAVAQRNIRVGSTWYGIPLSAGDCPREYVYMRAVHNVQHPAVPLLVSCCRHPHMPSSQHLSLRKKTIFDSTIKSLLRESENRSPLHHPPTTTVVGADNSYSGSTRWSNNIASFNTLSSARKRCDGLLGPGSGMSEPRGHEFSRSALAEGGTVVPHGAHTPGTISSMNPWLQDNSRTSDA